MDCQIQAFVVVGSLSPCLQQKLIPDLPSELLSDSPPFQLIHQLVISALFCKLKHLYRQNGSKNAFSLFPCLMVSPQPLYTIEYSERPGRHSIVKHYDTISEGIVSQSDAKNPQKALVT